MTEKDQATTASRYIRLAVAESKQERTKLQRIFADHLLNTEAMQRALLAALARKFKTEVMIAAARYGVTETEAALVDVKCPFGIERVPEGQIQYEMFGARRRAKG